VTDASPMPTPTQFAELMFGWKAFDYQPALLDDLNTRCQWVCARQVGKTTMAAIRALYQAVMFPETITLVLSPTQRQSGILFRRIKGFINANTRRVKKGLCQQEILIENVIRRETQTVIEFENGSEIHSLPAVEDARNIQGFTVHLLIVDEGGLIQDAVFAGIYPMLATTEGTILLIGRPNGVGNFFHKAYTEKELGFSTHHVLSKQSPKITKKFLQQEMVRMSDVEYRTHYLAEFVDTLGVMFPIKTVEACMKDCPSRSEPLPIYEYYLGYDPARFGDDEAVAVILEKRPDFGNMKGPITPFAVVNIIAQKGKSIDWQVGEIKKLHESWKFKQVVVDATAVGAGIVDPLVNANLPIEPISFSIKTKQDLYFNLLRIMEGLQVKLPNNLKMKKQFVELRQERQEGTGLTKIYHPRKGHDDIITGICLAVWGASSRKPQPILFGRPEHSFF
jgi:hypothetical protein